MEYPENIDISSLWNLATAAKKHEDDREKYSEAIDHFFKILLFDLTNRVTRTSSIYDKKMRKYKTSMVLYHLNLEGFSWKNGGVTDAYKRHFYKVGHRYVSIKDAWNLGLREKVENFLLQKGSDGKLLKDADGNPIPTFRVFLKSSKKSKGHWHFIIDWGRKEEQVPKEQSRLDVTSKEEVVLE